jgi:hypothetical protein
MVLQSEINFTNVGLEKERVAPKNGFIDRLEWNVQLGK